MFKLSYRCWQFALFAGLYLASTLSFGLKTVYIPAELQTRIVNPVPRSISFKLPIQQTESDWVFNNQANLLAGTLQLRIMRNNQLVADELIFNKGRFAEGWSPILPPVPTSPDSIYFGFTSTKLYLTAPGDRVELKLHVEKPVKGIGPNSSGVLAPGLYVTAGTYSGLIDQFDLKQSQLYKTAMQNQLFEEDRQTLINELYRIYNHKAFLNAWETQWSVTITTNSGWLDEYSQPEDASL